MESSAEGSDGRAAGRHTNGGARFVPLAGGRFKVDPPFALAPEDTTFLKVHRDETRRVLAYQADDAHLWGDKGRHNPRACPATSRSGEPHERPCHYRFSCLADSNSATPQDGAGRLRPAGGTPID